MCIINDEVKSVSTTSIFVCKSPSGDRQLTIYSNAVDSTVDNNVMILPFPVQNCVTGEQQVVYYDLSSCPCFFDNLDETFIWPESSQSERNKLRSDNTDCCDNNTLEVIEVGSYLVSTAHSVSDLSRLNADVFTLSSGVSRLVKKNYSRDFGFIICQLKRGFHEYHPFAYSHCLLNSSTSNLWLPTMHHHAHSSGIVANIWSTMRSFFSFSPEKAVWDHTIYVRYMT